MSVRRLGVVLGRRALSTAVRPSANFSSRKAVASIGFATAVVGFGWAAADYAVDYDAVRKDIQKKLEDDEDMGPTLVRLAWHSSGTYSKEDRTGGSEGARMRFQNEGGWGANAGLNKARAFLESIKAKYPGITYSDLWVLGGVAAIEYMGGPAVPFRPGRQDYPDETAVLPDGRLPDASKKSDHIRDIFYRMGFNDQEIVALAGAHSLGRCHTENSGFLGPWTRSPTTFSNMYFKELLNNKWTPKKWNGPLQYEDPSGELMMLPADLALIEDPKFRVYVELYANDSNKFAQDFTKAFKKLTELGVQKFEKKAWFFN